MKHHKYNENECQMEIDKKIDISKNSLGDVIISLLKAVANYNPVASSIASLVSDYQNHKQVKLIEDVLNRFLRMIQELDERVKNLEYLNSQDFVYDLLQTVDHAKDEQDEYRRNMYAKYLTSCCRVEHVKNRNKRIFLDLMGKMDELDYFILKSLEIHFVDRNAVEDVVTHFNYENHSNISQREVTNHFYYLTSLGIIEMPEQDEVDRFRKEHGEKPTRRAYSKERIYRRTTLGDDLYKFIEKPCIMGSVPTIDA